MVMICTARLDRTSCQVALSTMCVESSIQEKACTAVKFLYPSTVVPSLLELCAQATTEPNVKITKTKWLPNWHSITNGKAEIDGRPGNMSLHIVMFIIHYLFKSVQHFPVLPCFHHFQVRYSFHLSKTRLLEYRSSQSYYIGHNDFLYRNVPPTFMRLPCKYAIKFEKHLFIIVHFYFALSVTLNRSPLVKTILRFWTIQT